MVVAAAQCLSVFGVVGGGDGHQHVDSSSDYLSGAKLQCSLYYNACGHYLITKLCCLINEYTRDVIMFTACIMGSVLDSGWR